MNFTSIETVIDGQTQRLLSSDPDHVRRCASALGGAVCAVCDPVNVIESQYQGVTLLGTQP
ncbi:hypothetical protein D3C71_1939160 [compost metagenome]